MLWLPSTIICQPKLIAIAVNELFDHRLFLLLAILDIDQYQQVYKVSWSCPSALLVAFSKRCFASGVNVMSN